eukprot:4495453-Prymnesium_polylepis.1
MPSPSPPHPPWCAGISPNRAARPFAPPPRCILVVEPSPFPPYIVPTLCVSLLRVPACPLLVSRLCCSAHVPMCRARPR